MPMLFDFYRNMMKNSSSEYIVYMLETLSMISQIQKGKYHILKNVAICEILVLCIQKENPQIANTSAKLLIYLLNNSLPEEQNILKTTPIVEGALTYALIPDLDGKAYANSLLLSLLTDRKYISYTLLH